MKQEEAPKVRRPAKVFVKLSGVYENSAFVGSAYDKKQDDMTKEDTVEYLAKPALIQALMNLEPKFVQLAQRPDATGITKKIAQKQMDVIKGIINQIAAL